MVSIEDLRSDVEKKLNDYLSLNWDKKDILYYLNDTKYEIDLKAINENLRAPAKDFVLRGGKRIRPLLFLVCVELFGEKPERYLDYAVAIELIHNGTLVLDDIEDEAELRRGKPTVHKAYGLDTATNVGMSLHILPLTILRNTSSGLSAKKRRRMMDIYNEELVNVSFGQALDIYWHKHHPKDVLLDQYLEMVRLKTGSLMRMSMRLACALTNRSKSTERLFNDLAENLGIAFQIIDDCLDLDSQNEKFGKSYGNDITEGKLSLPVILTLNNAPKADSAILAEILQNHTKDRRQIAKAIGIIKEAKSIEESREFANNIIMETWTELEKRWSKRNNLGNLRSLAMLFVNRDY